MRVRKWFWHQSASKAIAERCKHSRYLYSLPALSRNKSKVSLLETADLFFAGGITWLEARV
ncbi:MAG: hypothetical protein WBD47_14145 [Phormidesmis sp.]